MQTAIMSKPDLTSQEIFDAVVIHSGQMPRKSNQGADNDGFCAYRGAGGNACFIGALVTDDEAKPMDKYLDRGESSDIAALPDNLVPDRLRPHRELLKALQSIHDEGKRRDWPGMFRAVSDQFFLSDAIVAQVYPNGAEDFRR